MNDTARKILFPSVSTKPAPVHRAWDIGFDSVTVTWFCGDKILLEQTFRDRPLFEIAPIVQARDFSPVGNDYVRPDAMVRDMATGKSRFHQMIALGLKPLLVNLDD